MAARNVVGVICAAAAFLTFCGVPNTGAEGDPDFEAQKVTVGSMVLVASHLTAYRKSHGEYPRDLMTLAATLKFDPRYTTDGWDRPFYYFRSEASYVLASFGRSAIPDRQIVESGWVAQVRDPETDIVVIGGEWSQTPKGVDATAL